MIRLNERESAEYSYILQELNNNIFHEDEFSIGELCRGGCNVRDQNRGRLGRRFYEEYASGIRDGIMLLGKKNKVNRYKKVRA